MKKAYTLLLAFAAMLTVNAQDPTNWVEGQDVTAEVGFGDASTFSGKPNESLGDYWKGSIPTEYEVNNDLGVTGFYFDGKANVDLTNIYQVVKIPAGYYTIKVQALYREGTPYDSFQSYFAGFPKKYAWMYATMLTSEDPESEATREVTQAIRSIASSGQTTALCTEADQDWKKDASAEHPTETMEVDDGEGNIKTVPVKYYCPCSLLGASYYFKENLYENKMTIILLEETYVRIGIRKTASIAQDWIPFTNWQIIYNGPANNEAQMEFAQEDCKNTLNDLYELSYRVLDAGFEGFGGVIGDLAGGFDDAIYDATTVEELDAIKAQIESAIDGYGKSIQFVMNLSELLEMSADMLASTEFPGKADFQAAYDAAADAAATKDPEVIGDDPVGYFSNIYNTLSKARADYLNTGEPDETGAKDFSALIKHPWFVNPEYTPTQNDDGTWTLKEPTWNWGDVQGPGGYNDKKNGRTDICSKVTLSADPDVQNQWFKFVNVSAGWSPGLNLFYQSGLIGVSDGWNSVSAGTQEIRQQLVGLPNGYYSVKALARGYIAGGSWSAETGKHNIFAQNSEGEVVASPVGKTDNDYPEGAAYGWNEWNPNVWQEHKTSIIAVPDGKLLIGSQTGMVGNFTGFRLMFYGEQPQFTEMIQEDIDEVRKQAEGLTFKGDIAAVNALLDQILLPITSPEAYEAALVPLREADAYVRAAKQAMKDYSALKTAEELMGTYTSDEAQSILLPLFDYAATLGEAETDTYELCAPTNEAANAYKEYMAVYTQAVALDNANVNAVLAEQVQALSNEMKDAATIQAYLDELAAPYNFALFDAAGARDASEANPVDVTFLLVNPEFTEGPTKGWTGASPSNNQYGKEVVIGSKEGEEQIGINAELWNSSTWTLSQKVASLPAGTYVVEVQALYRDGRVVTAETVAGFEEAKNEDAWKNHNAQFFAKTSDENDQWVYVKAIQQLKTTEPSFTEGQFDFDANNSEYTDDGILEVAGYKENRVLAAEDMTEGEHYPFDTKVGEYWYPASMYGFYMACQKNPEVYKNTVKITIENGETLEIGLRKTAAISADWVIFDSFKLFYLSGETFTATGINSVTSAEKNNGAIYNLAGQRVSKSYKGIIIENGVKKLNK